MKNQKLIVYFADPVHINRSVMNNYIPLSIGYIAAYVSTCFPKQVEFDLYKDPELLIRSVRTKPPHVLALTNYMWNTKLSVYLSELYKTANPHGITVLGGPDFPGDHYEKTNWLKKNRSVDFIIKDEGESVFANLLGLIMDNALNIQSIKKNPISGVSFFDEADQLVEGENASLLSPLDSIPSPYLEGLFDLFLKNSFRNTRLIPLFERTRGCPFSCTFCRNGSVQYSKIRQFSVDRFIQEIDYVYQCFKNENCTDMPVMITDQNFGSFPTDLEVAKKLNAFYSKYQFPGKVIVTKGKANIDSVLETIKAFPNLDMAFSVQSLDEEVLKLIKRKNVPVSKYTYYKKHIKEKNAISASEIILGLPGDTRQKHLNTIETLLKEGIDYINPFSFMMLNGTEAASQNSRKRFGLNTKWRLIPGAYSSLEDRSLCETEEIVVSSNTLTLKDFIYLRQIHLWMVVIFNGLLFKPLKKLILEKNIGFVNFLQQLEKESRSESCPVPIRKIAEEFRKKSEQELFESKATIQDLVTQLDFLKMLEVGKYGENLLQKHNFLLFLNIEPLTRWVIDIFIKSNRKSVNHNDQALLEEVFSLLNANARLISRLLTNHHSDYQLEENLMFSFDIARWVNNDKPLFDSKYTKKKPFRVYYDEQSEKSFQRIYHKEMTESEKGKNLFRLGDRLLVPVIESLTP